MKKIYSTLIFVFFTLGVFAQTDIYTPELKAPADGSGDKNPDVMLDWNPVAGSIDLYYEVELSLEEAFTASEIFSTDLTSYSMSNLLFGTQYFWRVRAIDETGSSDWSEPWSFTTLDIIELDDPRMGEDDQEPNVPLEWDKISGIDFYDVYLDTTATFDSPLFTHFEVDFTADTNYVPTDQLFFNQEYFWKVRARHGQDESEWSETRNFFTLFDFRMRKPNDNSTNRMPTEQIKWDAVDGVNGYVYQLATNPDFESPQTFYTSLEDNNADTLLFGVQYYVRALAYHNYDSTEWTTPRNFTIIEKVLLDEPGNGDIGVDMMPLFSWSMISGTLEYEFQLSKDPDFNSFVVNKFIPSTNPSAFEEYQYEGVPLDSISPYYWRVKAYTSSDVSEWSETWMFDIGVIGIEDLSIGDVSLYPNPAGDYTWLTINSKTASNIEVSIMDLLGQVVFKEMLELNENTLNKQIDVSGLTKGMYILRLNQEERSYTQKLLIK